MMLVSGIIIGLLISCLILLIEIRLIKVNSTITDKIAKQLERIKPKAQVSIINVPTNLEKRWTKVSTTKDVNLDEFYNTPKGE